MKKLKFLILGVLLFILFDSLKINTFAEESENADYLTYEEADYTNRLTNLIYGISDNGNKIARKIIKAIFKKLSYLVED